MSLKDQLKKLSTPISASYAIDNVRRKSLVYEKPQTVDALTCYHDCVKAFNKLCEVDPELKRFNQTLFSTGTIKLEMSTILPVHKKKIDEQVAIFLFMINIHLRSSEIAWVLEWLVYKYQIHLNYVENLMMLLLPHYETGLFAKGIQLLDFRQTAEWHWLQPYAECGAPLSRLDFLKACRNQPSLIPFIGNCMAKYVKYEVALSLNRIQAIGSFFVSTISGLCDSGLSDVKMAKIVSALQGIIRKALRSPEIPAFQSAACLAVIRIALKLQLNKELVMDWIGCLLKKIRNGAEWESIRMVSILMRTQHIIILPNDLSVIHQTLLNSMSTVERALLEEEENQALNGVDMNAIASTGLSSNGRALKATVLMDTSLTGSTSIPKPPPLSTHTGKIQRKLTVKRIGKMTPRELFSSESGLEQCFNAFHATLASGPSRICVMSMSTEECSCPSVPAGKGDSAWISDFAISAALDFTRRNYTDSEENEIEATLKNHQAKIALRLIGRAFEGANLQNSLDTRSPPSKTSSFSGVMDGMVAHALDEAFPCILVAMLHPNAEVRIEAFNLVQGYIETFQAFPTTADYPHVTSFLAALDHSGGPPSETVKDLLRGDALPSLVRTSPGFVQTVFETLCRQPLDDSSRSHVCWFAAAHLLHADLLSCLIRVTSGKPGEQVGWSAFIRLIKSREAATNASTPRACIDRLDAFTLTALARLPGGTAPGVSDRLLGIAPREAELLDALLELAGSQTEAVATRELNLPSVLSRLLLRAEHYVYCLAKLDATRLCKSSKSLFARVAIARKNSRSGEKMITPSSDEDGFTASAERSRLRALKLILGALGADIHRLQADSQTQSHMLAIKEAAENHELGNTTQQTSIATPLSSAVSRLKGGSCRSSMATRAKLAAAGDCVSATEGSGEEESMKDLVFPLNSHLFACISAESQFQRDIMINSRLKGRQRTISTNSSIVLSDDSSEEEDEGIQDDVDMRPIPLSDSDNDEKQRRGVVSMSGGALNTGRNSLTAMETANLREQRSSCAFEALVVLTRLFAEGNRLAATSGDKKSTKNSSRNSPSPMAPLMSVTTVMDTIFQCLSVFKETPSIQRQVMLCLIEMASLFPVVLCRNLVTLVQWVGGQSGSSPSLLLRLDDVHNLSLLGRLISVAVPALVQASRHCVDAALRVLTVFVRGLPDLPAHLPRRALALYSGLLRGLAQVAPAPVTPPPPHQERLEGPVGEERGTGGGRRGTKQIALQGWLWTATLIFLNTDWPTQATADLVFPLLIDLYNQFDLPTQLASWHQCMSAFLHLINNPETAISNQSTPLQKSKRARLSTPVCARTPEKSLASLNPGTTQNYPLLLKYLSSPDVNSSDEHDFPASSRKRRGGKLDQSVETWAGGADSMWPLFAEYSGLLSGVLSSTGHLKRRQEAAVSSTDYAVEENFGVLVKLVVQLLVKCSASAPEKETEKAGRLSVAQNLQTVLIQLNSVMPNDVFLDCVGRLMSMPQGSNLTRKALELLQAKLASLTEKYPPATRLLVSVGQTSLSLTSTETKLDGALERGLLNLFSQLSESLCRPGACALFSGDKTQAKLLSLRLSCLRELAQLLCRSHPNEMLKTIDNFLEGQPSSRWWPRSSDTAVAASGSKAGRLATSAAEARSMACLFVLECLARLPLAQISLHATTQLPRLRAQRALQFALDHSATSCRLLEGPQNCPDDAGRLTLGRVHSREEHLQAGVILMLGSFEFCAACPAAGAPRSVLDRLRECDKPMSSSKKDQNAACPTTTLDASLLAFLFRTTHLDLAGATQAKVDRSTASLKQSAAIIRRLRARIISLPESLTLLSLTHDIISKCTTETTALSPDADQSLLISGSLEFLSRHADHVRSVAAVSDVDIDSSRPGEGLPNTIETAYASNPTLVWRLLRITLESSPRSTNASNSATATSKNPTDTSNSNSTNSNATAATTENSNILGVTASAACAAGASLLAVLNKDYQLQLVTACLQWIVEGNPALPVVMKRLTSLFAVLERFSALVSPECFVTLVKNANLINLFVACLNLLAGEHKSRNVRKLVTSLEVPYLLECFAQQQKSDTTTATAIDFLRGSLAGTAAWLRAESKLSACLDMAGTDAVLLLPTAILQPLNTVPGTTEIDFIPCVAAFLRAVGGDEALLRPFGSCLSGLVTRGNHWRTRLAALRLLKQTFDTLVSQDEDENAMGVSGGAGLSGAAGRGGDLGLATCLVSDTLVALSEALEDDRPEVEAAANRLFADLEAAGATNATTTENRE